MSLTNNWYNQNPYPNNQPYTRYSRISIEDAISIAIEQVPGEVVKVELDSKNGVQIFEVDIINSQGLKYEVEIDAQTGRVLNIEID